MFSALAEDAEFFKERVNVFLMLAPVTRVDRCMNPTAHSMADKDTVIKVMRKMGPELMPEP